jgi:hypothetical protein
MVIHQYKEGSYGLMVIIARSAIGYAEKWFRNDPSIPINVTCQACQNFFYRDTLSNQRGYGPAKVGKCFLSVSSNIGAKAAQSEQV